MSTLGNLIWLVVLQGWAFALLYFILGWIAKITYIFKPIGEGLIELSKFLLFPFGRDVIREKDLRTLSSDGGEVKTSKHDSLMKILWIPFGVIGAITFGIHAIFSALTIIMLPVAFIEARLAKIIFMPIGIRVVDKVVAEEVRQKMAAMQVNNMTNTQQ